MGRGASLTSKELCNLAKALVVASADPIVGIDQTAARFAAALHAAFIDRAKHDATLKTRYRIRSLKTVKARMDSIATEVQKF